MPSYKLGYFNVQGRAEVARYIFKIAGVEFEDIRFDGDTWRAEWKDKTPFGQCPFLMVDGTMISDSGAITRYLGREFGLMGDSSLEEALINQTLGIVEEVVTQLVKIKFVLKEEKEKEEAMTKLKTELLPKFMGYLSKTIQSSGFLVGSKVSTADLGVFQLLQQEGMMEPACEKVKGFYSKIESLPAISKWMKERPT